MTQTKLSLKKRIAYFVAALAVAVAPFITSGSASAAQITARKVIIGSSAPSAVTSYAFTFTVPTTATTVQAVSFVPCTTASGACTPVTGFSGASAVASQPSSAGLGDTTGWTTGASTSAELRMTKAANSVAPTSTPVTVTFTNVTNPSALNSTFFIRMTTFSAAAFTGVIDTGVVATSTAGQITVNASVDEALTFTLSAATISLGTLTTGATGSNGTVTLAASTNAASGYAVTYTAPNSLRLIGPSTDIPAYTSGASSPGTAGFGFNLVSNTTPSVGANRTGTGTATAQSGYGTTNQYSFATGGTTIISVGAPSNTNTFTASFVANIDPVTPAGAYTTTVTYVATPNF